MPASNLEDAVIKPPEILILEPFLETPPLPIPAPKSEDAVIKPPEILILEP